MFEASPTSPEDVKRNAIPLFYWNWVGLEMNRITHSLGGPHTGPTMSSRALGLLHLAMHDAWFYYKPGHMVGNETVNPYLGPLPAGEPVPGRKEVALSAAAITVLDALYRNTGAGISTIARDQLVSLLNKLIQSAPFNFDTLDAGFGFGQKIAHRILTRLGVKAGEIGADQAHYQPKEGRYYFRDEPVNPVKISNIDPEHPERGTKPVRTYHGPYYGTTVETFAVTDPNALELAPPPKDASASSPEDIAEYEAALREVVRLGGAHNAADTTRTPGQTAAGLFWAYDGANLIGTPPRLYNQILRTIAWERADKDPDVALDEYIRLFALANTAMADAGKFSWREKYRYEFWRPLSGVREHHSHHTTWDAEHASLQTGGDPFWESLGAPETNTNKISFKPPFPAYPSGHATFGAACFQMTRLFYKKARGLNFEDHCVDEISFSFVSDELDGYSRDLHQSYDPALPIADQPGTVRTRLTRTFPSLWHAIFENAISRIFLGVHWRFDAFQASDVLKDPTGKHPVYRDPKKISYSNLGTAKKMIGGVPLGITIADQIFASGMQVPTTTPAEATQKAALAATPLAFEVPLLKSSNTNIR
jgi:vanadium chloroperoxidase